MKTKNMIEQKIIVDNENLEYLKAKILVCKVESEMIRREALVKNIWIQLEWVHQFLMGKFLCPHCKKEIACGITGDKYCYVNPEMFCGTEEIRNSNN